MQQHRVDRREDRSIGANRNRQRKHFPAALFMMALFVRNLQPLQYEPARTAQRIVDWYAVRPRIGLWGLLIALPLAVLLTGCSTLLRFR